MCVCIYNCLLPSVWHTFCVRFHSCFMDSKMCVTHRHRQLWPVSYASAEDEIHFTLSDSIKEPNTFRQHFCHTLNKSLTSELSVPQSKISLVSWNRRERWTDKTYINPKVKIKKQFLSFYHLLF